MLDMSSSNAVDEIKTRDPIYKISYDLSYKFIVRSIYDSDLKRAEISQEYRKLVYEHYLRRYYDFARESHL